MSSTIDWRSIEDDREKYKAYLCSEEWGQLRRQVHERAGGQCERCKRADSSHTHHLTYDRKYQEELADLQALCLPCHDFVHGRSDKDPKKARFQRTIPISCPECGSSQFAVTSVRVDFDNGPDKLQMTFECYGGCWNTFYATVQSFITLDDDGECEDAGSRIWVTREDYR